VDSRALIRLLEADGWALVAVKGSHHQFKHPIKPPHPRRDIKKGTEINILRQAGLR